MSTAVLETAQASEDPPTFKQFDVVEVLAGFGPYIQPGMFGVVVSVERFWIDVMVTVTSETGPDSLQRFPFRADELRTVQAPTSDAAGMAIGMRVQVVNAAGFDTKGAKGYVVGLLPVSRVDVWLDGNTEWLDGTRWITFGAYVQAIDENGNRLITSVRELDALPNGSVVEDTRPVRRIYTKRWGDWYLGTPDEGTYNGAAKRSAALGKLRLLPS